MSIKLVYLRILVIENTYKYDVFALIVLWSWHTLNTQSSYAKVNYKHLPLSISNGTPKQVWSFNFRCCIWNTVEIMPNKFGASWLKIRQCGVVFHPNNLAVSFFLHFNFFLFNFCKLGVIYLLPVRHTPTFYLLEQFGGHAKGT